MKRPLWILLLLLLPNLSQAITLKGETLWQGNKEFAETVRVEAGAVLKVLPGSKILFRGGSLEVAGRLMAADAHFSGENWQGIVLKGADETTVIERCRIEGAQTGIFIGGGAPRLQGMVLSDNRIGIEVKQKSRAQIKDSLFEGNSRVGLFIKGESTPVVVGNRFTGNGRFGCYIYRARPQVFSGNSLSGNATGLSITHFGSDPRIEGNLFENNEVGLLVDRAARPQLVGNRLLGNSVAVRLHRRSDARIEGNLLQNNGTALAISYSSYPRIAGNDIEGNGKAIVLSFQSSVWERQKGSGARQSESTGQGAFGQSPARQVTEKERRPGELDGTVDARDNWWGVEGTAELSRIGRQGNATFIDDGIDTATFEEDGALYPMDRVRLFPWRPAPASGLKQISGP